ncbi:MAG TPA: riboflavin kinase, partial [Pseudonocardia sp.]
PAEFAHEVLVERLHAAAVLVGRNFTFGHRATGTVGVLAELGTRFGFAVAGVELATDGAGDHVTFSSTYVRACIAAGDVEAAAAALGRPHRVEGVVVHGFRRGRELGFPTANVASPPFTALPADGVYAGRFVIGGRELPAAVSVGSNPTFSGTERTVEAHVLDVDEDFYGHEVGVDLVARLRGQERYDDLDALVAAIRGDVDRTRALLNP